MAIVVSDMRKVRNDFYAYLKTYGNSYSDYVLEYILNHFEYDFNNDIQCDVMYQVYAELGLFPDDKNVYKGFVDLVKAKHNINSNILEVAGGCFPILAKYIDQEQRISGGTITVYDPELVTNQLGNIKLIKEDFTENHVIDHYDLIIGFAPCDATTLIIKKANEAKKEFILALCGCDHSNNGNSFFLQSSPKYWLDYVHDMAQSTMENDCTLNVDFFDDVYNYPYPILSKKKNKSKAYKI